MVLFGSGVQRSAAVAVHSVVAEAPPCGVALRCVAADRHESNATARKYHSVNKCSIVGAR